jgi:hypothetical protein
MSTPILSLHDLDLQDNIFKCIMKVNVAIAMELPYHINPFNRYFACVMFINNQEFSFPKFFKWIKSVIVQVWGASKTKKTFSSLSFMKSKLGEKLNEHLPICCGDVFTTIWNFGIFFLWYCVSQMEEGEGLKVMRIVWVFYCWLPYLCVNVQGL